MVLFLVSQKLRHDTCVKCWKILQPSRRLMISLNRTLAASSSLRSSFKHSRPFDLHMYLDLHLYLNLHLYVDIHLYLDLPSKLGTCEPASQLEAVVSTNQRNVSLHELNSRKKAKLQPEGLVRGSRYRRRYTTSCQKRPFRDPSKSQSGTQLICLSITAVEGAQTGHGHRRRGLARRSGYVATKGGASRPAGGNRGGGTN